MTTQLQRAYGIEVSRETLTKESEPKVKKPVSGDKKQTG